MKSIRHGIIAGLLAATTLFAGAGVQAAEAVNTEYSEALTIESCAANVKSVYKTRYPENAEMIEELVDAAVADEEFICIFNNEGAKAFRVVEDALCSCLEPEAMPIDMTDDLYITKYLFPHVQQKNGYYCGPASTLMALIGSGAEGYYYTEDETITDKWQDELAKELYTSQKDGTPVWSITDVMKKNISASDGYSYQYKMYYKGDSVKTRYDIEDCVSRDRVAILRVNATEFLPYYKGYHNRHYIIVDAVDFNAQAIWIVDPHNNDQYFGRHIISFDEFYDLVENCIIADAAYRRVPVDSGVFWTIVYAKDSTGRSYIYS